MPLEIERRFLVSDTSIIEGASYELIVQGYFWNKNGYAARVRRRHHFDQDGRPFEAVATMALKGPRHGAARAEFESEIDPKFAEDALREIEYKVIKNRYHVIDEDLIWDVDAFLGDNSGLVIAECEMERVYSITPPNWCGLEVTDDRRYDNENLATKPFNLWGKTHALG